MLAAQPPARPGGHPVGYFENEIVPVDGFVTDEGPRDTSLEKMAGLKTLVEGGRLTAAMASQISDGASAVLLASEQAVKDHGLKPRARIHHISARGADPIFMLTGPIPATQYALEKAGLTIEDIDTVEINEAFAPVVMAWLKETGADPAKVNANGGAIALGHPLGATGAKLFATMLNELERTGGATACRPSARAAAPRTSPSSSGSSGRPQPFPTAKLSSSVRVLNAKRG